MLRIAAESWPLLSSALARRPNPLASVIQKIERMYGGAYASDSGEDSDEEGGSGAEEKGGEAS